MLYNRLTVSVLLLVHDDPDVLDWLTTLFEANGFDVAIGATAFAARAKLERTEVTAVLAGWDAGGGAGEKLVAWCKTEKPNLLKSFLLLSDGPSHDAIAAEQDLVAIGVSDYAALLTWSQSVANAPKTSMAEFQFTPEKRTKVLLVEDDPRQALLMRDILASYGFDIETTENAHQAIERLANGLATGAVDVIVSEWEMASGGGELLYQWIVANQPLVLERCIFVSGGSLRAIRELTPAVAFFPKGQDAKILVAAISKAARRAAHNRPTVG